MQPSGHVWMWELDCEESWALKNWCFWTVVLEKTLESPLDCKEIQPLHSKGDQSSVFFGRTDAKAETPILWPPHVKSWLIGKDSDAGRDWGQEEKGTTEDEMAGWHHRLHGVNSRSWWWTRRPGVLQFMGSQRVRRNWVTELNWTELIHSSICKAKKKKTQPKETNNGRMDKQTWHIHTMEYYLAIKGKKVLIHAVTWMKVENIMLSKRSQI